MLERLGVPWVVVISTDNFYRPLTPEEMKATETGDYDFDHPKAFDFGLMAQCVRKIRKGQRVKIPIYDFKTHSRLKETETIYGADVLVVEGILALYDKRLRDLMDLKVFVDTDSDLRLARRIRRDISERGRSLENVLDQYEKTVKPSFDNFCFPTKDMADLIIPHARFNPMAIDLLVLKVKSELFDNRGFDTNAPTHRLLVDSHESKGPRSNSSALSSPMSPKMLSSVSVLKETDHLRAIHTEMRDKTSSTETFVFATDRLCRLVLEEALNMLPFQTKQVETPTGEVFQGAEPAAHVCGVAIVRGGEAMEEGLRALIEDVPIGKVLIQQDRHKSEGPRVVFFFFLLEFVQPFSFLELFFVSIV
jgi:uridine kinase